MPKRNTVRDILRILATDGWFEVKSRGGSHRQLKHARKPGRVTVPGKPSDTPPPKTTASIWRQAGINPTDYE
jgi:predicted RNA binding protein YcfA (HicA-like mRNA interferase family)